MKLLSFIIIIYYIITIVICKLIVKSNYKLNIWINNFIKLTIIYFSPYLFMKIYYQLCVYYIFNNFFFDLYFPMIIVIIIVIIPFLGSILISIYYFKKMFKHKYYLSFISIYQIFNKKYYIQSLLNELNLSS
jgi:hypothetical protein